MLSENRKKTLLSVSGAALIGLVAGGALMAAPVAHAGAVSNFFSSLLGGGQKIVSAPLASTTSSLYEPAQNYEAAVMAAVKKNIPAVVSIVISENVPVVEQCPYNPFGNLPPQFQQFFNGQSFTQPCNTGQTQLQQVGGGTGFIISSDGLILTNKHVVSNTGASYTVIMNDGTKYPAKVLARDPNQDLAVLKIDASGLPTVTLGNSAGLQLGQTAIAIGNALGQFSNTVSVGVVSGLSRTVTASGPIGGGSETINGVIQTDAAINPGNSGGPLLDLQGDVIGIDTAVAANAQGIGFAIPIDRAKRDIASVQSTGQIETPYLGVRYIPVTASLAKQENLAVDHGALIRGDSSGPAVEPNSPAARAGVQAEDIITSVNGQTIDATHDLASVIDGFSVGQTVTLGITRGGSSLTLQATLAQRPSSVP